MDSRTLVSQMQQLGVGPASDAARQTLRALLHQYPGDVRGFARELLQRDLLTAYQANLLLTGKGRQLCLGPYLLLERLGEGGMGQVFKARHQRRQRVVALKVIRPERTTSITAMTRFFREVRAAARLSHDHIARAYSAARASGTYYFAMEYVRGADLAVYVKQRGPLPVKLACQLMAQAALGLQHIHEHGMVHRDIKPANLILAFEAVAADRPVPTALKIVDLGLARLVEDDSNLRPGLTQDAVVLGTADYIAPEQARDSRSADIRGDIYALGCTFYFALTGQPPFPGGTAIEKLIRHQLDEPAPLTRWRPDVPPVVTAILARMMAKQADQRYQTPAEVVAALAPFYDRAAPPLALPVMPMEPPTLSEPATDEDLPAQKAPASRWTRRALVKVLLWIMVAAGLAAGFLVLLALVLQTLLP